MLFLLHHCEQEIFRISKWEGKQVGGNDQAAYVSAFWRGLLVSSVAVTKEGGGGGAFHMFCLLVLSAVVAFWVFFA